MVKGFFHPGSGIGNQLHRYIATRIAAKNAGVDFGMIGREFFKGGSFMKLDMGQPIQDKYHVEQPAGKIVVTSPHILWEEKMLDYNPNFNTIPDDVIIDGEWQSELYFDKNMDEVRQWLWTEPLDMPDNLCILNLRGGEYVGTDLYLSFDYWREAMKLMSDKYPGIKFKCVTDDLVAAKKYFPLMPMSHEIGEDWRSIRYAKHLIISNSSFAILPMILNQGVKEVIGPIGWGKHSSFTGEWGHKMNIYKKVTYI